MYVCMCDSQFKMTRIVIATMARVWYRAVTAPKNAEKQKYLEGKKIQG